MNTDIWGQLAAEPDTRMCDERQLAELLGWTPEGVRRAVKRGELPPPIKLGRNNVYVLGIVREYITERARVLAKRIVNL